LHAASAPCRRALAALLATALLATALLATALLAAAAAAPASRPAAGAPPPSSAHGPAPQSPSAPQSSPAPQSPSQPQSQLTPPLSAVQVVQMLDDTVDWYRTLGIQQQLAGEPSDILIVSENRQIANQVVALAFDVARASADLLLEHDTAGAHDASKPSQTIEQRQRQLDAQVLGVQAQIQATRAKLAAVRGKSKQALQAKLAELQGALDLLDAKKSILGSIAGIASQSGAGDASSLRSQIDAMAVALPGAAPASGSSSTAAAPRSEGAAASAPAASPASRFGLWDEAANVFKLSEKVSSIDAIDRRTQALQTGIEQIRARLVAQLRELSARGDVLMRQLDTADVAALEASRKQFDALADQFKQASVLVVPLRKQGALLDQYRRNLMNWRDAVESQSRSVLKALAIRVGVLALVLGVLFALAQLWHRAVLKYVQDSRRRYQLLLLRRIALWFLVVIVVGFTFASELSSIVTFAGLITAGLAVAMQSVLVSIVGYFFLIGKYGIRVGDRVQIGEVSGEIIELGLVRMYLMEFARSGSLAPTGRVAAFPNSVVFQVSTGLFKQIPGVSFAWHDITLGVPPGADYESAKEKLFAAANEVLADYREEIERQARELQRTMSGTGADALPTVQLSYSTKGVDAHVHYPVHLSHAAEIDERMSRALLQVVSALTTQASGQPLPAT